MRTKSLNPSSRRGAVGGVLRLAALAMLLACGLAGPSGVLAPRAVAAEKGTRPCDIYAAAGTACVAAHSTTRALYSSFDGALYQVQRMSDGKTRDIPVLDRGGYADSTVQDRFCRNDSCIITIIYDQSPNHNDLPIEGAGDGGKADIGAPANALPVMAGGYPVYGLSISPGMGYRNDSTRNVAKNGAPEGMYMVASGTHHDAYLSDVTVDNLSQLHCCFNYGNAEAVNKDTGAGHLDSIDLGSTCWFGGCFGTGPWFQADLENGVFQSYFGGGTDPKYTGSKTAFVTGMLKNNGQTAFALKNGDAQQGPLTTTYSGILPTVSLFGLPATYAPMHQEGGIALGTGGDNSNSSEGSFFEGVMTAGYPTDRADDAVQANIVAVGYGGPTGIAGVLQPGSEISLATRAPCCASFFVSHGADTNISATIQSINPASTKAKLANATWIVRPGLADQSCLSLESRNYPGDYLTVQAPETANLGSVVTSPGQAIQRISYDGTAAIAAAATFCPQSGLDGKGRSFKEYGTTKFIRVFNRFLYAAQENGSNPWDTAIGFADDASFTVTGPLSP